MTLLPANVPILLCRVSSPKLHSGIQRKDEDFDGVDDLGVIIGPRQGSKVAGPKHDGRRDVPEHSNGGQKEVETDGGPLVDEWMMHPLKD